MQEDKIKQAFSKVKEDIFNLQAQISSTQREIQELKRTLDQTHNQTIKTVRSTIQTDRQINQTVPQEEEGLKPINSEVSIGNKGVQTDRQTNRQTDRQTQKFALTQEQTPVQKDPISQIDKVSEVLDSLDTIKKELRSQFKKLTPQEMLIFSTLYQLEDQGLSVDYALLSEHTKLSESSIRDYIQKLIKKGIPVNKAKEDNKRVILSISSNFKRMASLKTILQLREL